MKTTRRSFLGMMGAAVAVAAVPAPLRAAYQIEPQSKVTVFDQYIVEHITQRKDKNFATQYYLGFTTRDGKGWHFAMLFDDWNEKTHREARTAAEHAVRRMMTRHGYTWGDIKRIET